MGNRLPPRIHAFLCHLAASLVVAAAIAILVFQVWYPHPLNKAVGVTHIFGLILLVDASLGPLLTLVVYKPGKKSLKFDLAVIVCLQLAALAYGVWAVASQRPAWLVYNIDRFDLVQASAIDHTDIEQAAPQYRQVPWTGPRWVGARPSADPEKRTAMLFAAAAGGADIPAHPELYRPLPELTGDIQARARPLEQLDAFNDPTSVAATLQQWPAATRWVPLMARARPMVVLLDGEHQVVAMVDLRPWE